MLPNDAAAAGDEADGDGHYALTAAFSSSASSSLMMVMITLLVPSAISGSPLLSEHAADVRFLSLYLPPTTI